MEIGGAVIPRLIDELPVLAVAAAFAQGETVIRDATELKVKESNRIAAMVSELSRAGADVTETEDGMIIRGGRPLHGAAFETYHDHRIAMSMAVCALACSGDSEMLTTRTLSPSLTPTSSTHCIAWEADRHAAVFGRIPTFRAQRETYALFGYPLGHTMSPDLHAALFAATGRDADYIAVTVPPEELSDALALAEKNSPAST